MARYIDLDKLLEYEYMECLSIYDCREIKKFGIEYCANHCCIRDECFLFWANNNIKDITPVVHAEWINKSTSSFDGVFENVYPYYVCTNCNRYAEANFDFCPHCGAKMDKGTDMQRIKSIIDKRKSNRNQ